MAPLYGSAENEWTSPSMTFHSGLLSLSVAQAGGSISTRWLPLEKNHPNPT